MNGTKRLLFYSRYAFYKPLYAAFEQVCADYGLDGFVISHEKTEMPKVYAPEGYFSPQSAGLVHTPEFVTVIPSCLSVTGKWTLLKEKLEVIRPDYIWAHEEPTDRYVQEMLRCFYFRARPLIVVAAVENRWRSGRFEERFVRPFRTLLWKRYNGALGAATKSIEAIQRIGMPRSVPARVAWLPHLSPPPRGENGDVSFLPQKKRGDVFVGFAGRITAAKGWRVLLAAMAQLPESFKCLIAGTGEEESELRLWCLVPALTPRIHYLGVLEKERLWEFYRALDVFVLPSLTTPHWAEQFGSVLAEAMSCGVPLIGSNSGAIPEVIGDCGLIVPENDSTALAEAIYRLASDPLLRTRYTDRALLRFEQEFSLRAYAAKLGAAFGLRARAKPGVLAKRVEAQSELDSDPVYTSND